MNGIAWITGGAGNRAGNNRRRLWAAMLAAGPSGLMLGSAAAIAGDPDTAGTVSELPVLQETPIVFASVGDFGAGSSAENNVAMLVDSWSPDFIVAAGDNRYGTSTFDQAVGQYYCGYLTDAGVGNNGNGGASPSNAFFPVLGNHDTSDGAGINEYLNFFTLPGTGIASSNTSGNERYYDFLMGPVHFFALDSQEANGCLYVVEHPRGEYCRSRAAVTGYCGVTAGGA